MIVNRSGTTESTGSRNKIAYAYLYFTATV